MFTCPNSNCKKVFNKPLKALNLQNPTETYDACPFCLIEIEEQQTKVERKPEEELVEKKLVESEATVETKRKNGNNGKTSACNHHLGYLSERGQNEMIPDECLTCKDTVECMLKKMR